MTAFRCYVCLQRVERHCRVEEELEDKDKQMAEIIKETEAKTLQLQHCRKCLREEKDKNSVSQK